MKRSAEDGSTHAFKKHKNSYSQHTHDRPAGSHNQGRNLQNGSSYPNGRQNGFSGDNSNQPTNRSEYEQRPTTVRPGLSDLPPPTSKSGPVPAYIPFTTSPTLPPLPEIPPGPLSTAPFRHKSSAGNANIGPTSEHLNYERLEFLGDAYIELAASRLIFSHYPTLPVGQQSQLRELLVKNETLASFSQAYGFDKRVEGEGLERMMGDLEARGKVRGGYGKGFVKVLGDVFEAFVAAVVLSDFEEGFAVVEKWLQQLWAPKLVTAAREFGVYAASGDVGLVAKGELDPLKAYNPTAKAELQKRILGFGVKLEYEQYKDSIELKGDQLGQNRIFIALYLSGYGYERKVLGKGEGKNKVEAGNWAATEAMHGEAKEIVEECEKTLRLRKEEHKAKLAAEGGS